MTSRYLVIFHTVKILFWYYHSVKIIKNWNLSFGCRRTYESAGCVDKLNTSCLSILALNILLVKYQYHYFLDISFFPNSRYDKWNNNKSSVFSRHVTSSHKTRLVYLVLQPIYIMQEYVLFKRPIIKWNRYNLIYKKFKSRKQNTMNEKKMFKIETLRKVFLYINHYYELNISLWRYQWIRPGISRLKI